MILLYNSMFLQNSICNIYNITYVIYQYYIFVSICNIYVITYKLHINYILYNCVPVGTGFCHNSHPSVDQLHPQRNPTADYVCTLLVPVHSEPQFTSNYHPIRRCRVHMGSPPQPRSGARSGFPSSRDHRSIWRSDPRVPNRIDDPPGTHVLPAFRARRR